jgi:hypothetical protein
MHHILAAGTDTDGHTTPLTTAQNQSLQLTIQPAAANPFAAAAASTSLAILLFPTPAGPQMTMPPISGSDTPASMTQFF